MDALARESAAHAELRAVNEILADSSRIAERLRISRDLHDILGHHLTALSLNLEAAVQRTDGEARQHAEVAQSLAKKLLADVREIAATMQTQPGVDLSHALGSLVEDVPRPRVHLEIEPGIRIDDPERAHILVRCTQEIVTNAARHSAADNLWITIARDGDSVRISARDDGRGAVDTLAGFGLRMMRDRLEGAGGELHVDATPGRGFQVVALLPARPA
jgi:signal transduction histidine kinase